MSEPSARRSRDSGGTVWDFRDHSWVVCPRCAGAARSTTDQAERRHRLVCGRCSHALEIDSPHLAHWIGDGTDGRFGLPLYLTEDVSGQELWVHNLAHLEALAVWIGASLRERAVDSTYRNKTMASRLPHWMKTASARPRILKALDRLRTTALREGLS